MDMKQFEPKSSNGRDDVILVIIMLFILFAFQRFLDWLLRPLNKEGQDTIEGIVEAKQEAREEYLGMVAEDATDPMSQFQARFLEDPKAYRGDPDNKVYKTWYESWKKGEILDSTLRWVPVIYKNDSFTPEFIDYMKIQYALHKKASWINKTKFFNTIRKYYPEFTTSFQGMAHDLARYSAMVNEETLQVELQEELVKYGLSESSAEYLAKKDLSSKELRRQAEFLKSCADRSYDTSASICALENKCGLEEVRIINIAVKSGLPANVGLAYLREEITAEEIVELKDSLVILNQLDSEADCEELIEDKLKDLRSKKRALKFA